MGRPLWPSAPTHGTRPGQSVADCTLIPAALEDSGKGVRSKVIELFSLIAVWLRSLVHPRSNTLPASTHTGLRASQGLHSCYSISNAKCEISVLCKSGHILTAADRCVVDIVVDQGKIRAVCINAVYLNADA